MCKAPKPPKPKPPEKPEYLRNEYLDAAVGQSAIVGALRTGRSRLRIPLGSTGRTPGTTLTPTPQDNFNANAVPGGPGGPSQPRNVNPLSLNSRGVQR